MKFIYTNAYVGPYCVSYAEAQAGDTQIYRFPLPVISREHLGQGLMITEGKIRVIWPESAGSASHILEEGGSFALDGPAIPFAINSELTLEALTPSAFLCVTATGIEQKVHLDRYYLEAGDEIIAERYALIAVAGTESLVAINGREAVKGIRLLYGRDSEITVCAVTRCVIGKFSFSG